MSNSTVIERRGYSLPNWAKRWDIPRSTAYWMAKEGHVKTVSLPNGRMIVTAEADEEFAASLEQKRAATA
jgi:predicted site-specific integrase-resolvase